MCIRMTISVYKQHIVEGEMHCELSRQLKAHPARLRRADPHLPPGMSCLKGGYISTSIGEER